MMQEFKATYVVKDWGTLNALCPECSCSFTPEREALWLRRTQHGQYTQLALPGTQVSLACGATGESQNTLLLI